MDIETVVPLNPMKLSMDCREDFDYEEELLIVDEDLEYNSLILMMS